MRLGEPLPERIQNAPILASGSDFYIEAFFDLGSERQIGFGEGPIPTTAVLRYAKHYEMTSDEEADLLFFIKELDACYLKYQNKKNEKKK